jgi:hypothetical protein
MFAANQTIGPYVCFGNENPCALVQRSQNRTKLMQDMNKIHPEVGCICIMEKAPAEERC